MKYANVTGIVLLFLLLFSAALMKVIQVPVTHDEPSAPLIYRSCSAWEIMMYPDEWPRNHILNTLATKASMSLFGNDQWAIRLPNLLSFVVYFFSALAIIRLLFKPGSMFVLAGMMLFLGNPYLLDFFTLCRGYGMGVALVTASSAALLYGFSRERDRYIWLSVTLAMLAAYANFTMLIFWVTIVLIGSGYLLFRHRTERKRLLLSVFALIMVSAGFLALIYTPIVKMTSTGQFIYWSSDGFYQDTLLSLADGWRYQDSYLPVITRDNLVAVLLGLVAVTLLVILRRFFRNGLSWQTISNPLTLTFLLLSGAVTVNLMQTLILHTPNLSGRTALVYLPLFSMALTALLARLEPVCQRWIKLVTAILIPGYLFLHLAIMFDPGSVREWKYDRHTLEVLEILRRQHEQTGETITLNTSWLFMPSFYFYTKTGKAPWLNLSPYHKEIDTLSTTRFYYVPDSNQVKVLDRYHPVKQFQAGNWLLERNP